MNLIQLLMVRRYSIQSKNMTSYQTLIGLAQTHEFKGVTRLFSKRRAVEQLVEMMCDNHPTA